MKTCKTCIHPRPERGFIGKKCGNKAGKYRQPIAERGSCDAWEGAAPAKEMIKMAKDAAKIAEEQGLEFPKVKDLAAKKPPPLKKTTKKK